MARGESVPVGESLLDTASLASIQSAISDAGVDGWLIYDFHGLNPIAVGLLQLRGMTTRRFFVYVPAIGVPTAITHNIEQGPWKAWPSKWGKERYSSWRELESKVRDLVGGKKVAMEYSPGDAVPYLDRVPAGVIELVRNAGANVVSSADLVSRFYAVWTDDNLKSHKRAAEIVAQIARKAFERAGEAAGSGSPLTEFKLQQWILGEFSAAGLNT